MQTKTQKNVLFISSIRFGAALILLAALLAGSSVTPVYADSVTVSDCSAASGAAGRLVEVVAAASADDTVNFSCSGTIQLAATLVIDKNLTLDGVGQSVTLSGDSDGNGSGDVRVLFINSGVTASLKNLTITKGLIDNYGAGIHNEGSLTVADSIISENSANSYGAGLYNAGTLTVTGSLFFGNQATDFGAGLYNGGIGVTASVTDSTFSDNQATYYGGGIFNNYYASLTVTNSTFSDNDAFMGAGIVNEGVGTVIIANSTFSGNVASPNQYGIGGWGGGMRNNDDSTATVINSTFADNNANLGGGIFNRGTLNYSNTLMYNPTAGRDCYNEYGVGIIGTNTYNLVADGYADDYSCGTPAVSAAPHLGNLRDNGGPTWTMALLAGSPAIDWGDAGICTASPVSGEDQRGVARGTGACDIGAFEYEAPSATTGAASSIHKKSATVSGTVNGAHNDLTVTFEYGTDTSYGSSVDATPNTVTGTTDTSVSAVISGLTAGTTYHYRVVATTDSVAFNGADQTFETGPNAAPTDIALVPSSVAENQPDETLVGTLSTTDPDVGDTFTYSYCGGPDDSEFELSADQLFTYYSFDKENRSAYQVCIRSTDDSGATFDKVLTITITNVNETPEDITLSNNFVDENSAINTVVGTFNTIDPDSGNTFTYSLACSGADNAAFNIAGSQLRTSAVFDYETRNTYEICVRSTDQGLLTVDENFTIDVWNLDDTPNLLDPTFGTGGKVVTDFTLHPIGKVFTNFGDSKSAYGYATAIQADGKIVVAGYFYKGGTEDFALARYNTDGTLDAGFGTNGLVTTDLGGYDDAFAIALQSDGKIVAAGSSYVGNSKNFALARYNTDGTLDSSFGTNGLVTTDFGNSDTGYALAIQPNGKIVVAGSTYWYDGNDDFFSNYALARYNSDGALDTTFDTDGKVTTDFNVDEKGSAVAIQADGKIVVAGSADIADQDFTVLRYNADGSVDTGFGTAGLVTVDFGGWDHAAAVAIQTDGKIIVAGSGGEVYEDDFSLARFNPNGSLDTDFGTTGKVSTDFGGADFARAIDLRPDGEFVVAGSANPDIFKGGNDNFALALYTSDGSLDTAFGTGGKVTTDFNNSGDTGYSVAFQIDGKIVVAGSYNENFALVRYSSNGSLDADFGTQTNFGIAYEDATAIAIQSDGRIVAAGYSYDGNDSDFALARYNPNGLLDTSFGTGGKVTTDFSGNDDEAHAIAIQLDGKIVVVGSGDPGWTTDFALARYNSNGSLDTSFDTDGKVFTSFGSYYSEAYAVVIQPDGKIVVAGHYNDYGSGSRENFALARYNSDGSLDTSFDTDGLLTTDFDTQSDFAKGLALQPDGKILAVGSVGNTALNKMVFGLARYNSDGSLDTTFDTDGKVLSPSSGGTFDYGNAVALQPGGKILVAGSSDKDYATQRDDFALVRFNSDGSLDTTFGTAGLTLTDFGNSDSARAIAIQPGGSIILVGETDNYPVRDFAMARYTPNGLLNLSFGTNGKEITDFHSAQDRGYGVAIQADGKVVAAGSTYRDNPSENNSDFALARYIANELPSATTNAASEITTSSAILNGLVNANNFSTAVTFEYGLTTSYGTTVTASPSPVTGTTNTAVSQIISGLAYNTPYHYRVVGVSTVGTTYGDDLTFTTLNRYTVSGTLGVNGAAGIVTYTGGSTTADGSGAYAFSITSGWTGMITPSKTGYTFTPPSIAISTPVTANLPGQNFTTATVATPDNVTIYRRATGGAYWLNYNYPTASFTNYISFGDGGTTAACYPAPMDFDGDGIDEPTHLCGSGWHFFETNGSFVKSIWAYMQPGDMPAPGDYDGDGTDEVAVYRRVTGGAYWLFYDFATAGFTNYIFLGDGSTTAACYPAAMDFDGDGSDEPTHLCGGGWHFFETNGSFVKSIFAYMQPGDMPAPGDYNGDGTDDIAVYRRTTGGAYWLNYNFATTSFTNYSFLGDGSTTAACYPAPMDFDGDGMAEPTHLCGGGWHFFETNGSFVKSIFAYMQIGDKPVPGKYGN